MERNASSFNSTLAPNLDLPDSCNEFNTYVIPSRQVAYVYELIYRPFEGFIVGFGIPAVSIFGILCNMAFIVLLRVQNIRTLVNFYLANLAIVDMCLLANTLFLNIFNSIQFKFIHHEYNIT